MASASVDTPQGTTVTAQTSGFSMNLTGIAIDGIERAFYKTSHFGTTGAHTKAAADLEDYGTMTLTGHFNPDTTPPTQSAVENWVIQWPAGTDWTFSGGASSYASDGTDMEGPMTCTVVVEISGQITPDAS